MQIRTILYQYIKTLIKHVFLLNFTYELLMSFRMVHKWSSDTEWFSYVTDSRQLILSVIILWEENSQRF